ncbi:uncharacterized protein LOC112090784 [Morus notabilis]|uniref:uncharacterized protein LOC112090784 n=1 Tax=Morus notabilis TaxID=981085 RepID=UPI000CED4853|nr:uncharacterized protein LOC112090784 [Morus notabilis]
MLDRDEEHTAFITDRGLYCYKVMPFGLKNAGATYQRLVNKMFAGQIGKSMEVYVDDMLVKSKKTEDHVDDLRRMFGVLRAYKMKLNPRKCAFGVASGKFLGFMVSSRGIEANPEKIHALLDMESPRKPKEVQKLTGHYSQHLYLAVSEHAVSSVLIREEKKVQMPVYYTSKRLLDAETRYLQMEKLALALIVTARKLRHYFQAHSIQVLTNHPLRQVLQKPDTSGRLLKWSIELSQFDINYKPRNAIRGQALADFVAEFTRLLDDAEEVNETPRWKLYVDGSSNDNSSGAGLVLHTPEGHKITSAIRFDFPASNNEAEYEALLAGLRLAEHLKAGNLDIFSDSQLIVNQVKGQYQTRDEKMAAYLKKVKEALGSLAAYDIQQVPRAENSNADALAKLATSRDAELLNLVPVEVLKALTTKRRPEVASVDYQPGWMDPITRYLAQGELPEDRQEAKRVRYQAARFGVPHSLVSDNGKQFNNDNTRQFCELLGIYKNFSFVVYPQSNGQVEAVNKIIKVTLKRRLNAHKGKWADELPKVLWAYRTTSRTTTGETPFSMAYGIEVVLPVEVSIPTSRITRYEEGRNAELMGLELDLLEERRTDAELRLAAYRARTARYYNKKVRQKRFVVGDLVLRVVTPNTKPRNSGTLGLTWEGPYRIREIVANGSYRLAELDGQDIKHTWNTDQLKVYYQ